MMHDGNGWYWGFGFGHRGLGILFWGILILLLVALVKYVFGGRK